MQEAVQVACPFIDDCVLWTSVSRRREHVSVGQVVSIGSESLLSLISSELAFEVCLLKGSVNGLGVADCIAHRTHLLPLNLVEFFKRAKSSICPNALLDAILFDEGISWRIEC